ncbi:uncharacterized protein LOC143030501 [Oratosquilla oratoria]|uniref:uncharacterized protein LOC143030501 n=1 Tax=Oratosquilla oratoria TaxID=337810 RepID=UPI003F7724D6
MKTVILMAVREEELVQRISFLPATGSLQEACAPPRQPPPAPSLRPGDTYCLQRDAALQGVANCVKVVDGILLFDEGLPAHFRRIHHMLTRCRSHGITLNKKKFTVVNPSVRFCGYRLSADGISADEDKNHSQGHLHLVQCAIRFLTGAETPYVTIELKMLAATWAASKCKLYLLGFPHFMLLTDHRPLIPILNSYTLDTVENPHIQQLKERLSPFVFTAMWCAGKQFCIPDVLSQDPVSHLTPEDDTDCHKDAAHVRSVVAGNDVARGDGPSSNANKTVQNPGPRARVDPAYGHLVTCVSSGFPSNRLALPSSVLLHRGVEATKRRAQEAIFLPSIDSDIKSTVEACEPCQVLRLSHQHEPLLCDDHPTGPFESVSADFFHVAGKSFLVLAPHP